MKAKHEFKTDAEYNDYLRIYFAAMAMQGLLTNYIECGLYGNHPSYPMVAEESVRQADALMKALNETNETTLT